MQKIRIVYGNSDKKLMIRPPEKTVTYPPGNDELIVSSETKSQKEPFQQVLFLPFLKACHSSQERLSTNIIKKQELLPETKADQQKKQQIIKEKMTEQKNKVICWTKKYPVPIGSGLMGGSIDPLLGITLAIISWLLIHGEELQEINCDPEISSAALLQESLRDRKQRQKTEKERKEPQKSRRRNVKSVKVK